MLEYCVTVERTTHKIERPFLVMATQNPVESEGTYNLPEAQLDRFMFKMKSSIPRPKKRLRSWQCTAPTRTSTAALNQGR